MIWAYKLFYCIDFHYSYITDAQKGKCIMNWFSEQ